MACTGDFIELISAPETTYGTEGIWDKIVRLKSADWEPRFDQVTDADQFNGVMGTTQVLEADIRKSGKLTLKGFYNADHSYLIHRFMGDDTTSTLETGVYQHIQDSVTLTERDFDIDSSLSFQKNESASVPALLGCKCSAIEVSGNAANNDIDVTYEFFGQTPKNTDTTFDKGAITYPTVKDFHWKDLTVSFGDDSFDSKVTAFKVRLSNDMVPEWASTGTATPVELDPKNFTVTGELKLWYESNYVKALQEAGTTFDVVFTFENDSVLLGATKYAKSIINVYKARITEPPKTDLAAGTRSLITLQFEGLADSSNSNKIATITNQDTTATFTDHA